MPFRPPPFREVKCNLQAAGFVEHSQKRNHVKFIRQTERGLYTAIVPRHREVAAGTLRSILRQSGLDVDEFEGL